MRLIDADALTLCTYDYDCCCGSFKAVPEETLAAAPTLVVGPDGDIVPESFLAKWYRPEEKLPDKTDKYIVILKDTEDDYVYKNILTFLKDNELAKDGWYESYLPEYQWLPLESQVQVLCWLQLPELLEGVVLS